jgi:hypothetical protein
MIQKNAYAENFICPTCGKFGSIYLAKLNGPEVIIKQRCPEHGGRKFVLPLKDLDSYIDLILEGTHRCFKCGGPAVTTSVTYSGAYALIDPVCQRTKKSQKTLKIWSLIYIDAMKKHQDQADSSDQKHIEEKVPISEPEMPSKPEPESKTPPKQKLKVCPNCGTELEGNEKFCGICGSELDF